MTLEDVTSDMTLHELNALLKIQVFIDVDVKKALQDMQAIKLEE